MNIEYRPIKNYPNYKISNTGKILNIKKNKHLKNVLNERYLIVLLYKDGMRKKFYVHRLVAETFIKNIDNKTFVNHKDLNKINNNVENLEWVTPKENIKHYTSSDKYKKPILTELGKLKIKQSKYKKIICRNTNSIFKSLYDFAKFKNISLSQASQKLNGRLYNNLNANYI